jgi:NDP-sugar pyrophosphorylase family protein
VTLGAVVVVGAEGETLACPATPGPDRNDRNNVPFPVPLPCTEVLGRSVVEQIAERFVDAEVEEVTVLVRSQLSWVARTFRPSVEKFKVLIVDDLAVAISQTLSLYAENGVDYAFVTDASAYTECDFTDLLWFHRGTRQAVTRTSDHRGPLNFWIVTCAKVQDSGFAFLARGAQESGPASYFISDYVNRLAHPRDMRKLVQDVLRGHCEMRPLGKEIRPGVWVDDGAQIHGGTRIVAPAYIGSGSTIGEDSVVTRCSNIESNCYIDYGTVIEDSSILPNSYVGIWLDVAHTVVQGNKLWNLDRDVALEMHDPSVIRINTPISDAVGKERKVAPASRLLAWAPSE